MSAAAAQTRVLTGGKVLAMLLAFFGIIIVVNTIMSVLAVETLSGTEVSSAYSASLAYEGEIKAAQRQDARHWNVTVRARRDEAGTVSIRVEARDQRGAPITGLSFDVQLQRPVDKRFDRDATLSETGGGVYAAQLADVAAGQWDLLIAADSDGKSMFQSRNRIVLN